MPLITNDDTVRLLEDHIDHENNDDVSILNIVTQIIRQGIPMALSYTFPASMVATAILISHLKDEPPENYLAAATLVTTMTHIIACVSFSPFLAMITIGSEKYGELQRFIAENNEIQIVQTQKNIADLFKASIVLSTLILPIPFAALFFSDYILSHIFAQNKHISWLVQQNLRAYSYAMPGLMYRICMEQILFSFGKSQHTMLIGLATFSIGTALAYYFAFGSPNLGLSGIAYGFVVESYLTAFSFAIYMWLDEQLKNIPFYSGIDHDIYVKARALLKMGLPITVQMSSELSTALLIGLFAGWQSDNALAAQNFSIQLFTFSIIPSDAFAQTIVQMVNQRIGEKKFNDASRIARYGLLTNIGLISLVCIPVSIAPSLFASMFASKVNTEVAKMVKYLVPLAAAQTVAETAGLSMTQTLRAANDLYKPTLIKITCLWIGVSLAYLLGFETHLGIYGINIGFLLGVSLGSLILTPRWAIKTQPHYLEQSKISEVSSSFYYHPESAIENMPNQAVDLRLVINR